MKKLFLVFPLAAVSLLGGCNPDHSGDIRVVPTATGHMSGTAPATPPLNLPPQAQKGVHGIAPGL